MEIRKNAIFLALLVAAVIPVEMSPPGNARIQELQKLLQNKNTEEAVQLARGIHDREKSSTSLYNLAVSLEHEQIHVLEEAATILQGLYDKATGKQLTKEGQAELDIVEEIAKSQKVEQLVDLHQSPDKDDIRLFLLKLYFRLGKTGEMKRIVQETASVDQILKTLTSAGNTIPKYDLGEDHDHVDHFTLGGDNTENRITIQDSPVDLSHLPPSVQNLTLKHTEAATASGGINLPHLKFLRLMSMKSSACLSHFKGLQLNELRVQDSSLDVSLLPPALHILHLTRPKDLDANWLSKAQLPQLELLYVQESSVDLSHVPQTVETLDLYKTQISKSAAVQLPHLKFLILEEIDSAKLAYFQSTPLTLLELLYLEEVNVDLLPATLKDLEINNHHWDKTTNFAGGVRELNKVVLRGFPFDHVDQLLSHLHPKVLAAANFDNYEPKDVIPFLNKPVHTIAIGKVDWSKEAFSGSALSQHVDKQSDYYLVEGGKGKAIDAQQFAKFSHLE